MPEPTSPEMRFALDLVTEDDPDSFLTTAVLPAVESLEDDPGFAHFYFTRPGEEGARIRLHLAAPEGASVETLRDAAEAALSGLDGVTLRFGEDPPETEHYGGSVGLELCERQFELSSRAVLDAMDDAESWDGRQTLGVALPLHLGFAAAAGFDRVQAAGFFADLAERRFPDEPPLRDEMEKTFEAILEGQRAEIEPAVDLIWNTFSQDAALGEPWADRFYVSMRNLTDEMIQALRTGHLDLSEENIWPQGDRLGTPCWRFGGLLFEQVHETDRRLGLSGADEIYLSHLLAETLKRA